jgi:hypothetical protein
MAAAAATYIHGQEAMGHLNPHRKCVRLRLVATKPAHPSTAVAGRRWPEAGPVLSPPLFGVGR